MRILLVNVNTTVVATDAMVVAAQAVAGRGTQVEGLTPTRGSAGVDSNVQSLLAAVGVMDAVVRYREPFDAVVLGGFGERGRERLQELLDVPVVDIAEAAVHTAMLLGRTFSVVTTLPRSVAQLQDRLLLAGLHLRCASVRAVGRTTRELDEHGSTAAVVDAARAAVEQDGAEVVVHSSPWRPPMEHLQEAVRRSPSPVRRCTSRRVPCSTRRSCRSRRTCARTAEALPVRSSLSTITCSA